MSYQSNPYERIFAKRPLKKILIICEGQKTEKFYFEAFETDKKLIEVKILGAGRNKDSLVEYAIEQKRDDELKNDSYTEVWVVFDRDSYPIDINDKHKFNRAIQIAKNNQIKTAYSNDAFEIWYILHFNYHQTAWSRDLYKNKLTELLKMEYKKNDSEMYKKLESKQEHAIRNAKRLLESYQPNHNPESDNPSTTVHKLVERLNNYLKDDGTD